MKIDLTVEELKQLIKITPVGVTTDELPQYNPHNIPPNKL